MLRLFSGSAHQAAQRDPLGLSLADKAPENCMPGETQAEGEFIVYPVVENIQTSNLPREVFIFR